MISIPSDILVDIVTHAREELPIEACGLLVGTGSEVVQSYRMTNVDASHEHFSMDPREQFNVIKDIRARGLDILAIYHSHPATPARMSEEDLRLAFDQEIKHVIISLAEEQPKVKCFLVSQGQPNEEQVLIEDAK